MNLLTGSRRVLIAGFALALPALVSSAATYLPMSDADLVAGAPIVARATVMAIDARVESIGGEDRPFTLVTLALVEAIKGSPGSSFVVRLPGGKVGDDVWSIPGAPVFAPGQDVVLMLAPHPAYPGQLRLTEFGLSRFDLVSDDTGRRFAVRPAFPAAEDLLASRRTPAPGSPAGARDAESFLAFLRAAARGDASATVAYAAPVLASTKWANIGGREPGDCGNGQTCLFRWFWDTGNSPNAVLTVNGTQSNLVGTDEPTCGTDSVCDVQNAATAWHAVPATDIRLSGPTTPGNVTVNLDATSSQDNGTTWNTPLGCTGGTIGLGGPGSGHGPRTYRGDGTYYFPFNGTVNMRKVTCNTGYSAATFRTAVLHEVGHVLGLAHPDQDVSIHSTTTSNDWNAAVMHSVVPPNKPDTPQTDDVQAVTYYYGTAAVGASPTANFTISNPPAIVGSPVNFADASTGGATGWNWDFGDPGSGSANTSTLQNASHVFSAAQTYTVTLTAGSLNGSNAITKQVTVQQPQGAQVCTADATTLCLNGGRFKTTIVWQKPDGTSGSGHGVGLTSDSGYFWFFSDTNIESVVKVLNACGINNHYWVFAAGLTNVKATLTVLDTQTGSQQQYVNPQGTAFAPIQDTSAFSTCP